MSKKEEFAFVVDKENKKLKPTKVSKAWYLIRKNKAKLISEYPMVIKLNRVISKGNINKDDVYCGIDDGSKNVGLALVQKCKNHNKVLFKGTIYLRNNVSNKMSSRRDYRKRRRSEKRYRPRRQNNRKSLKKKGRIPPSIKQKKESIIRVLKRINKYIDIDKIFLEDVKMNIRKLTENKNIYNYTKSNRLDANLRQATLYRDNFTCQLCYKKDIKFEAHHIKPRRMRGADSIYNLITLCYSCHSEVTNNEVKYMDELFSKINGKNLYLNDAMHVMQGKKWLQRKLSEFSDLKLTSGGDTANKRIHYNIKKSHSNDAVCIANLLPISNLNIKEFYIKPLRKKNKFKIKELNGFKGRDLIKYSKKNGEDIIAFISSLRIRKTGQKVCSFTDFKGKTYFNYSFKNVKLLDRPKGILFY
ncbi:MAG: RNA-guided endonuclease IscB [bacterium]